VLFQSQSALGHQPDLLRFLSAKYSYPRGSVERSAKQAGPSFQEPFVSAINISIPYSTLGVYRNEMASHYSSKVPPVTIII